MQFSAEEIARAAGGKVIGDPGAKISGISDLKNADESCVSFVLSEKYVKQAEESRAKVIISDSVDTINGKTIIKVKNAKLAYIGIVSLLTPKEMQKEYISPKASVSQKAKIGKNVYLDDYAVIKDGAEISDGAVIYSGVFVGENSKIGKNTIIYPNVSIYRRTEIGDNTIIHAGCVIGADGFGFVEDCGNIVKVPQIGYVKIGNNAEIGANTTVDRGAFGPTVIGDNVKLDNLVQVAHNVKIGEGTIIAAQTGISGSTEIGKYSLVGGQVGFVEHIKVGNFVKIGAKAGISKDTADNAAVTGAPARPIMEQRRSEAYVMRLKELFVKVKELETEIKKLKEK